MPLLPKFDTPGSLRDFPAGSPFYDRWHNLINGMLGASPIPGSDNIGEFYNPHLINVNPVGEKLLVWMGFPRELLIANRDNRQAAFQAGDVRGNSAAGTTTQVEYLEWFVTREKVTKKIKKVTFTTETPEYWQRMFDFEPARVLELYRNLVSTAVMPADLVTGGGSYNPLNKWNTTHGIVHYIVNSPANTLGAAIGLAKGSVRLGLHHVKNNYEITGGLANTSADPRVVIDVNMLARKGLSVTGREPIGLYMVAWDDTGWTKPDGSPVGNYWRIVRGAPGAALRLEYEVPPAEGFLVGDILIGGRPIKYGGHLAEHVTVMIGGLAGTRAV